MLSTGCTNPSCEMSPRGVGLVYIINSKRVMLSIAQTALFPPNSPKRLVIRRENRIYKRCSTHSLTSIMGDSVASEALWQEEKHFRATLGVSAGAASSERSRKDAYTPPNSQPDCSSRKCSQQETGSPHGSLSWFIAKGLCLSARV
jgi:hypothetical protein